MMLIAYEQAKSNPFVYLLFFVLLWPPICIILFGLFDWLRDKIKKK